MKRTTLLLCCALAVPIAGSVGADTSVKRLAPGVLLIQEVDKTTPLVIDVLDVDLDAPGIHLGVGIGQDKISGTDPTHGREDVSRYARRHGVLAAVNADFFPFTGDPVGLGIKDGELFSEPWTGNGKPGPRATLGVTPNGRGVIFGVLGFLGDLQAQDGQRTFLSGIDRVVNAGEVVVDTPLYGPASSARPGGTQVVVRAANVPVRANKLIEGRVEQVLVGVGTPVAIPGDGFVLSGAPGAGADFLTQHVHVGERIGFVLAVAPVGGESGGVRIAAVPRTEADLPSRSGEGIDRQAFLWARVSQAVGGGPRLLVGGQVAVDGVAEGFDAGFTDSPHPRTAAGLTRDGRHLLLVTVDGRQSISRGVSLPDLALILKRYGAWDAINFDGGGSTCMAVGGLVINSPEGSGAERPVADMFLVQSDTPDVKMPSTQKASDGSDAALLLPSAPVPIGSALPLKIGFAGKTISGGDARVLWQGMVTGGVGFVNQRGYFIPLKPGTGTITALFRGRMLTGTVSVQSPSPVATVYTLRADFAAGPGGAANRSLLTVRILDGNGAPLAGAPIQLAVTGGVPDTVGLQTNADGYVTVGVTWDAGAGGTVRVLSGTLPPLVIPQPSK